MGIVGLARWVGWIFVVGGTLGATPQMTWFVDDDATGLGDGSSWTSAFDDLQDALAAANAGDEIWVAEGTYTPAPPGGDRDASFLLVSGVRLYGGFDGTEAVLADRAGSFEFTVLSGDLDGDDALPSGGASPTAENSYHVLRGIDVDDATLLDGFLITGGNANPPPGFGLLPLGGGVFLENDVGEGLAVRNCAFRHNAATLGGAVWSGFGSSPRFQACVFEGNSANTGSAIAVDVGTFGTVPPSLTMSGCTLDSNGGTAVWVTGASVVALSDCSFASGGSGAILDAGEITIARCTFEGHGGSGLECSGSVRDCSFLSNGRGMSTNGDVDLVGCDFGHNVGNGGLTLRSGTHRIVNSRFFSNVATTIGGALTLEPDAVDVELVNCEIVANESSNVGGGICAFAGASFSMINCALVANRTGAGNGGGVLTFLPTPLPTISNCILWGNESSAETGHVAQIALGSLAAVLAAGDHTLIEGLLSGTTGAGNIDADPLFVDLAGADGIVGTTDDDLGLRVDSPCIDAGRNSGVPADALDLDGDGDLLEPTPRDVVGQARFIDELLVADTGDGVAPLVDMGAREACLSGPSPSIVSLGCGINPTGSFLVAGGTAAIGTTVTLAVDNPLGTQGVGSIPLLVVGAVPAPGTPCGISIPGFGMAGPGSSGELLVFLTGTEVVLIGPSWSGPGSPVSFDLPLPFNCKLLGASLYTQGVIVDPFASQGVGIALADGVELRLGA